MVGLSVFKEGLYFYIQKGRGNKNEGGNEILQSV